MPERDSGTATNHIVASTRARNARHPVLRYLAQT